jgi:hydroxymethylpyrimidine pyrophosphatase-like HAD family hydrolase
MVGEDAGSILEKVSRYISLNDVTVMFNEDAVSALRFNARNFSKCDCVSNSYSIMYHNEQLVKDILSISITERKPDILVFDLDNTLVGKFGEYHKSSVDNINCIGRISRTAKIKVVTGNSLSHVNSVLGSFNGEVYCDGGANLTTPGSFFSVDDNGESKGYFVSKEIVDKTYYMGDEISNVIDFLTNSGIPRYKIENRGGLVISVKPLKQSERSDLKLLINSKLDGYEAQLNGRTTVDICKIGYSKLVAVKHIMVQNPGKHIFYVGDEIDSGNDSFVKNITDNYFHYIEVKNPDDTNVILNLIENYLMTSNMVKHKKK